jgi:hypothetical protein
LKLVSFEEYSVSTDCPGISLRLGCLGWYCEIVVECSNSMKERKEEVMGQTRNES